MSKLLIVSSVVLLAFVGGCVPLHGQTAPTRRAMFLKDKEQTCASQLASGQKYEYQYRTFEWMKNGTDMYTSAVAYYAQSTGEFLWVAVGGVYTEEEYFRFVANEGKFRCDLKLFQFLLLQDGQWVAFDAINSGIRVYYSDLRFQSINSGWEYAAQHPEEWSSFSSGRWVEFVSIGKELGPDFFRPDRLGFDARPFTYHSLTGVTKVGANWQLDVKGPDEPNRAVVLLDSNFKLLRVTKIPASSVPTDRLMGIVHPEALN